METLTRAGTVHRKLGSGVGANQSSWSEPERDLNCQGNAAVLWKGKSTK